ncbi:uncharacterized protein RHOBADRAFT_55669 [Rhodotorula graminis WP1]|uniref:Uncharacterized protein n=1 Tax=Rhodotorula graminis (strain WP1) TaxID=578459 RepID=A0A0P9ETM2_RHOGW|nr:uncharacterized protein RHOBADRAFT_55669 [Rhodotorula graminis WP1]KPV72567.1 hypothetical protein RHOBADRAFT_55669 [Rhodotorula graminis WP1]
MPSDLRSTASRSHPPPPPPPPRSRLRLPRRPSPLKVFLTLFALTLYLLTALRYSLPPFRPSTEDRVLRSRPALRSVERYSPQHKYRPASSPVVQVVAPDGSRREKGRYY